jgi:hypothetical protein
VNVVPSKSNKQKMTKIGGSGSESGSIRQRHGSAVPDPDPHQNVMDPQQLGATFRYWNDFLRLCEDFSFYFASDFFTDLVIKHTVASSNHSANKNNIISPLPA